MRPVELRDKRRERLMIFLRRNFGYQFVDSIFVSILHEILFVIPPSELMFISPGHVVHCHFTHLRYMFPQGSPQFREDFCRAGAVCL